VVAVESLLSRCEPGSQTPRRYVCVVRDDRRDARVTIACLGEPLCPRTVAENGRSV
jgi:hypothetical protein